MLFMLWCLLTILLTEVKGGGANDNAKKVSGKDSNTEKYAIIGDTDGRLLLKDLNLHSDIKNDLKPEYHELVNPVKNFRLYDELYDEEDSSYLKDSLANNETMRNDNEEQFSNTENHTNSNHRLRMSTESVKTIEGIIVVRDIHKHQDGDIDPVKLKDVQSKLGDMVKQITDKYSKSCHLVLVTPDLREGILQQIVSSVTTHPQILIDLRGLSAVEELSSNRHHNVWGTTKTTCRVLLLDLSLKDTDSLFNYLEESSLWLYPFTQVIMIGAKSSVHSAFDRHALRNTLDVVYLGIHEYLLEILMNVKHSMNYTPTELRGVMPTEGAADVVSMFSRCFFCNSEEPRARLLLLWYLGSHLPLDLNLFPDQLQNMYGHRFRVVSVTYFPFMDYSLDSDESATTVTPKDSLDFRILKTFSAKLNFTYEIRAPWDMQWGNPMGNGNWTGIVGTLQHHKADFSTVMAPNSGRLEVLSHARAYTADTLVVTSLKPQPLTQYLLVVRPFTDEVWIGLIISILLWSVALWALQKAWASISGGESRNLISSIFYGLGILLEDIPSAPPSNITGQMLVGWWLVFCLVISNGFRSSLVAHLTVQAKTPPIDSLQDLVKKDNWGWGIEQKMLLGAALNFFKSSTDPVVQEVYEKLEIIEQADGLQKILKGGFSFLAWSLTVRTEIECYHTDNYGKTPYYIGKKGSPMLTDFGWGFRKGAPFQQHFSQMMNRLIEAGILDKWKDEIMTSRVSSIRKEIQTKNQTDYNAPALQQFGDQVPLKMNHLQGIFMLLFVGYGLALLLLLGERLVTKCMKPNV